MTRVWQNITIHRIYMIYFNKKGNKLGMKILSWNVNGLKSILKKEFYTNISQLNADIICLQETKISRELEELKLDNYYKYFNYSKKNGYSGVGILAKEKPINVIEGIEIEDDDGELINIDKESRVITLEYNDLFIVSVYVPHSQNKSKYNYRQEFDCDFIEYIEKLNNIKDTIICGDFNVCHKKLDVCDFQKHTFLDNFTDEERASFDELLELGFIDTYRYLHPQMREYTFWNNTDSREEKKSGWRLDYILISKYLKKNVRQANILKEIGGSDHCPIEIILKR